MCWGERGGDGGGVPRLDVRGSERSGFKKVERAGTTNIDLHGEVHLYGLKTLFFFFYCFQLLLLLLLLVVSMMMIGW